MKRMYVLASRQRNYSKPYVQGAHALAQYAIQHPDVFKEWNNHTLIFVECENIEKEYARIQSKGDNCVPFFEPDYNNNMTAVCVCTDEKYMDKYRLM